MSATGGHEKCASKVGNITRHLEKAPSTSFNIKVCVIDELTVLTVEDRIISYLNIGRRLSTICVMRLLQNFVPVRPVRPSLVLRLLNHGWAVGGGGGPLVAQA